MPQGIPAWLCSAAWCEVQISIKNPPVVNWDIAKSQVNLWVKKRKHTPGMQGLSPSLRRPSHLSAPRGTYRWPTEENSIQKVSRKIVNHKNIKRGPSERTLLFSNIKLILRDSNITIAGDRVPANTANYIVFNTLIIISNMTSTDAELDSHPPSGASP